MVAEYFIVMALLMAGYLCLRSLLYLCGWSWSPPEPADAKDMVRFLWMTSIRRPPPTDFDGKGFDAVEISSRVRQVREQIASAKLSPHGPDFKRASLVENKRAQISGMAYFQRPPLAPELPESEQG